MENHQKCMSGDSLKITITSYWSFCSINFASFSSIIGGYARIFSSYFICQACNPLSLIDRAISSAFSLNSLSVMLSFLSLSAVLSAENIALLLLSFIIIPCFMESCNFFTLLLFHSNYLTKFVSTR